MACVWRLCGVCAASHVGRLGTRECMYRCHATLERFCDDCIAWDEVAAIGGGPSVRVQRTVCAGGITQMLRSGCMSVLVCGGAVVGMVVVVCGAVLVLVGWPGVCTGTRMWRQSQRQLLATSYWSSWWSSCRKSATAGCLELKPSALLLGVDRKNAGATLEPC